jgi:hypothetical protein
MTSLGREGPGAAAEVESRGTFRGDRNQARRRLCFESCAGGLGIPGDDLALLLAQGRLGKTSQGEMVRKQQRSNRHAVSWSLFLEVRRDKL